MPTLKVQLFCYNYWKTNERHNLTNWEIDV